MIQASPDERAYMRVLIFLYDDREEICATYAQAERTGEFSRTRGPHGALPEKHAKALFRSIMAEGRTAY